MPRDSLEAISRIERALIESGRPMSVSRLAKKTKLHYTTVKRYVNLLESIKKMPTVEFIEGDGNNLVRLERDLSKANQEEIKKIIKQHAPEMTEEEKLLISLLEKKAVSQKSAVRIKSKIIGKLVKSGRLNKIKNNKIYLTDLGYGIASGAREIYRN